MRGFLIIRCKDSSCTFQCLFINTFYRIPNVPCNDIVFGLFAIHVYTQKVIRNDIRDSYLLCHSFDDDDYICRRKDFQFQLSKQSSLESGHVFQVPAYYSVPLGLSRRRRRRNSKSIRSTMMIGETM